MSKSGLNFVYVRLGHPLLSTFLSNLLSEYLHKFHSSMERAELLHFYTWTHKFLQKYPHSLSLIRVLVF